MAKTLTTFARTNQALVVKVGVVDGQVLQPEGLKALADLPSRDALRAQIAGGLQGPLRPAGAACCRRRSVDLVLRPGEQSAAASEPPEAAQ